MSQPPVRAVFAIPGDIDTPTGGYAYDRRVLERLSAHGVEARHCALPGGFPRPSADELAETQRLLASVDPDDVLLVDGLAWGAMPLDLAAALGSNIVALCHHPLGYEAGLSKSQAQALTENERMTLAFAARVIVSSATTRDALVADFGVPRDKIVVAEPGTERCAQSRGSGGPGVRLLAVGSVTPRKGYDVLLAALAPLASLDWRLDVAGALDRAPGFARNLQARVAELGLDERVALLGPVSDAELDALYDRADVFVSASLYEGYGMVLTEAMARGLCIVASTGGAAADTLPDAAGLKVPPGAAPALSDALRAVIEDAGLRADYARAARAAAERLPDWDGAAATIAAVLREVAERGTS